MSGHTEPKGYKLLLTYRLVEVIMARPREGEGIKRTICKRGDKLYAYEVTSQMVNGKKKTISKYLGRIDPQTNELMDKIPEKSKAYREKISMQRSVRVLEDIKVGDYGGTYLLDRIQRDINLGDDLDKSFGSASASILALGISLIYSDGIFDSIEGKFKSMWTPEYYDLAGTWDSGTLSRYTKKIGGSNGANIESFFAERVSRNRSITAWDLTTMGTNTDMDGLAEYNPSNKDNEDLKQVKLGFVTDIRGIPLMYRFYPRALSDMDTVERLTDDISRFGGSDAIYVMDREFCSASNLLYMSQKGYRFVLPTPIVSSSLKKLLTQFNRSSGILDKEHNGHMYKVWKTELGIIADGDRKRANGEQAYSFINISPEEPEPTVRVTAYVCYDSKKYSDEIQAHNRMINGLKEFASTIDSPNPVEVFKKRAGKAFKHFDVVRNDRKLNVTEKKNSKTFAENRAGLFVMLTSEDIDWNTMMTIYDARAYTEQAYDRKKGENNRFRTSDKDTMRGREFLRFIDLILRCEIGARIREAGAEFKYTVDSVLSVVNCIQAREYDGVRVLSEIGKKQREIFDILRVPLPDRVLVDRPITTN